MNNQFLKSFKRKQALLKILRHVLFKVSATLVLVLIITYLGTRIFEDPQSYFMNLYTELIGIIVTVGILGIFTQHQEQKREKNTKTETLMREITSPSNQVAINALNELRHLSLIQNSDSLLKHSSLEVNWEGANLDNANLEYINLFKGNLSNASLENANLQNAYLRNANLNNTNFYGANLKHVNFNDTLTENINLTFASLCYADLANLKLDNLMVWSTDFSNARLTGVSLRNADLRLCNFENTNLYKSDLTNTKIASNLWNENTVLPDGKNWHPDEDLSRFTDPTHINYWDPSSP